MAAIFGPGGPIILLQTEYRLQGGPFLRGDHPRCDTTTTATARGASPLPLEVPFSLTCAHCCRHCPLYNVFFSYSAFLPVAAATDYVVLQS